jgi:hypothetical protein
MQAYLQLYGLVFLLGSLTVAALSDLRRMAAQRDFAEVWGVFAAAALFYDTLLLYGTEPFWVGLKWVLVVLFVLLALKERVLNVSLMDVAAVSAVASLLDAKTIVVFYAAILVFRALLRPVLSRFGEGGAMPFLPVVLFSSVSVLAYGLYVGLF